MVSRSHKRSGDSPVEDLESRCLDAVRDSVLAVGVTRTTMTDVARRAGVSRMTLYRRWPDLAGVLADAMTREWTALSPQRSTGREATTPAGISSVITATVSALQDNPLFHKILDVDPDLLLPYVLDRRGRTQQTLLDLTIALVAAGQHDGAVRSGDPALLGRLLILTAQGFALSSPTMADAARPEHLLAELRSMLERYLTP